MSAYQNALHLFPKSESGFLTKVLPCSALTDNGMDSIWALIQEYEQVTRANGFFDQNRQKQNVNWMHDQIRQALEDQFYGDPEVKSKLQELEDLVKQGKELPGSAAEDLLRVFLTK
jgi:LAO/AO transport system kinase